MTILYRNFKLGLNSNETELPAMLEHKLRLRPGSIRKLDIVKRSLDSRGGRRPRFVYSVALVLHPRQESRLLGRKRPLVEHYRVHESGFAPRLAAGGDARPRPVIIGAGPAGLFAAWRLAAAGVAPVIVERGPEVTDRAKRWHAFIRGGAFDPECNLLFGEGGAGAFSDGKLYTRVNDPRAREVLEVLADHGAPREILLNARPHVGSNLLPSIIRKLRRHLVELGVEVRFDTCMEDLRLGASGGPPMLPGGERSERGAGQRHVTGVQLTGGRMLDTDSVFLGTGHSARDTWRQAW